MNRERKSAKVLVLEDEDLIRILWEATVKSCFPKINLHFAESIKEAVEKLKRDSFHVVVLDTNLPDGSTLECFCEIKELCGEAIIAVGSADSSCVQRWMEINDEINLVFQKPQDNPLNTLKKLGFQPSASAA